MNNFLKRKPVNNHKSMKVTELISNQNVMTCKKTTKSFWGKKRQPETLTSRMAKLSY